MTDVYLCYVVMIVPSLFAVIYGIADIMRKHRGLYFTMGVLGVVCILLGQFAYCASSVVGHAEFRSFHIGNLGAMGSYLFFLTANMGPMDTLADDNSPDKIKYRYLALLGPGAALLIYGICILLMVYMDYYVGLVSGLVITAVTTVSLYYSTKMALITDVKGGFVDCMRPYNIAITVLGLLNTLERGVRNLWIEDTMLMSVLYVTLYAVIGLANLSVIIFLKMGAERWKST